MSPIAKKSPADMVAANVCHEPECIGGRKLSRDAWNCLWERGSFLNFAETRGSHFITADGGNLLSQVDTPNGQHLAGISSRCRTDFASWPGRQRPYCRPVASSSMGPRNLPLEPKLDNNPPHGLFITLKGVCHTELLLPML
jgi:hypothetical protein